MKPWTIVFLVVVLVACALYIVVRHTDLFQPQAPEGGQDKDRKVFAAEPGAARKLVVVADDGSRTVFETDGDDWRITEPIRAKAERYAVTDITRVFEDLQFEEAFGPEETPKDETTGLDKPWWTLSLTDAEGKTFTLQVGRAVPLTGAGETYLRAEGDDRTFVVKVDFTSKLARPLHEFRDKTVLDLDKADIVRVRIAGAESYELAKTDGRWGIVQPVSAGADKDKVDGLLDKFARLEASEFVADAPKDVSAYGLDPDKARLIATCWVKAKAPAFVAATQPTQPAKPPTPHTLLLGNRAGQKVLARIEGQPAVFKVDAALLKDLQPALHDLRDKQVLEVERDLVVGLDLVVPAGKAKLVKTDGQWHMETPFAGKANGGEVGRLLDDIGSLEAAGFHDRVAALGAYGLDKPRGRITLHLAGRGETVGLLVGANSPSGEMTFVKSAAGATVADVGAEKVTPLLAAPAIYWHPLLMKLPEGGKITRLALKRPDGAFTLVRGKADAWSLTAPVKADADDEHVNKILDTLEDLQATKIISLGAKVPEQYAKAAGAIVVTMTVAVPPVKAPPAETQPTTSTRPAAATAPAAETIVVHAVALGDNAYAWIAGRKVTAVGEFAKSLHENLSAELRDRSVVEFTPGDVTGITITSHPKTRHELRREKNKWVCVPDPAVPIDADKVDSFLKGLQEIKAVRFTSHRASDEPKLGPDKLLDTVELSFAKAPAVRLVIAGKVTDDETGARYASVTGVPGVFLLSEADVGKVVKSLKDFRK